MSAFIRSPMTGTPYGSLTPPEPDSATLPTANFGFGGTNTLGNGTRLEKFSRPPVTSPANYLPPPKSRPPTPNTPNLAVG